MVGILMDLDNFRKVYFMVPSTHQVSKGTKYEWCMNDECEPPCTWMEPNVHFIQNFTSEEIGSHTLMLSTRQASEDDRSKIKQNL